MPVAGDDDKLQTRAAPHQVAARKALVELFEGRPMPTEQLLVSLGVFMRSSVLAKVLYVNELYELVLRLPGVICEFGVWWGQNLALFESLRAVHEPYNYTRKVIGFDTFSGYTTPTAPDAPPERAPTGGYALPAGYDVYLERVLRYHEAENPMAHVKKFELVKGDASTTVVAYLKEHPETLVSLAYFDMGLYEPTKRCLEAIRPHLVRGAVIAMDELNSSEFPGETLAFTEVFGLDRYRVVRSRFLPDRSYAVIE